MKCPRCKNKEGVTYTPMYKVKICRECRDKEDDYDERIAKFAGVSVADIRQQRMGLLIKKEIEEDKGRSRDIALLVIIWAVMFVAYFVIGKRFI